jgi:amino acid transporter
MDAIVTFSNITAILVYCVFFTALGWYNAKTPSTKRMWTTFLISLVFGGILFGTGLWAIGTLAYRLRHNHGN